MLNLQGWEIGLLAVAVFVATSSLVQLMRRRRDELTRELLGQAEEAFHAKQESEKKLKKQNQRRAA
jgi:hypothetical protein